MQDDILTHENFMLFAAKHYNNPTCHSYDEFVDDLQRLKYIKKLITRFIDSGDLKERLLLNHIIILSNVFSPKVLCQIIWLKMPDVLHIIKPFLILLNILPDKIYNVGERNVIDTTLVSMDQRIVDILRKI